MATVTFEIVTDGPAETFRLGRVLGELLPEGLSVALMGGLGAGKTVLVKGIARGLGVSDEHGVTSPSFVLVNEYRGRVPIYHVDLYRLDHPEEVEGIGWDDLISGPGVTLVEWADRAQDYLPPERVEVQLEWAGEQERKLLFCGRGWMGGQVVEELEKRWMREGWGGADCAKIRRDFSGRCEPDSKCSPSGHENPSGSQ